MKQSILVIDDEQSLCDFLSYYLKRHGFQVTTTIYGADAPCLLDENHYHLVILDVVLKGCDGLELLTEIKNSHPQLPVLMLTGLGFQEEVLQEARKNGADGYLSKTLAKEHLLMEVRRLLNMPADQRRRLSQRGLIDR